MYMCWDTVGCDRKKMLEKHGMMGLALALFKITKLFPEMVLPIHTLISSICVHSCVYPY